MAQQRHSRVDKWVSSIPKVSTGKRLRVNRRRALLEGVADLFRFVDDLKPERLPLDYYSISADEFLADIEAFWRPLPSNLKK